MAQDFESTFATSIRSGAFTTLLTSNSDDAVVDKILPWNDGVDNEWREKLPDILKHNNKIAIEMNQISALVRNYIYNLMDKSVFIDLVPIVSEMRMIKSKEELQLARHAGKVAMAMMDAGKNTIAEGVAEYEVAIATATAGTRKASEILSK